MAQKTVGRVFVRRTLDHADGGKVVVEIGRPYTDAEGAFWCPYQVKGLSEPRISRAGGVDEMDALQSTLQKIAIELSVINENLGGAISWRGDNSELGFPMSGKIREILKS